MGRHLAFWTEGLRRSLAARVAIGEDRFIDVTSAVLVKQPVAVFERIYDWLGMPLTAAMRRALGEHRYTAEQYALTEGSIRVALTDHIEQFTR